MHSGLGQLWADPGKTWWGEPCMDVGVPLSGGWQLEGKYVVRDGRAILVELHVHPAPPKPDRDDYPMPFLNRGYLVEDLYSLDTGSEDMQRALARVRAFFEDTLTEGFTGADLKRIQVTTMAEALERFFRERGKEPPIPNGTPIAQMRPPRAKRSQRGRPLGDKYWARLSEDYLRAVQLNPNAPIAALERRYREDGLTGEAKRDLLRDRVALAHRKEWLQRTGKRGRGTGSRPGPRLLAQRKALKRLHERKGEA